jgi:drug/metabolite transporter (DMT)-like permease
MCSIRSDTERSLGIMTKHEDAANVRGVDTRVVDAGGEMRADHQSAGASKRPDRLTLAVFLLSVLLGGANGVAVRFSNMELPPFWGAFLRFACASMLLFGVVLLRRSPMPSGRALVGVLLYGLLGFGGGYAFIYWGLVAVPAGLGQVVLALVPLLTFFLALAHRQETFRWRGLLGGVLAVLGISIAYSAQVRADVPLLSLLAVAASAACTAEAAVIIKKFPRSDALVTNAIAMGVGALLLLCLSFGVGERWFLPAKTATWAAVVYLVIVGSIAVFTLYLFVLRRWTASATTYAFVLIPFVTVLVSAWLTGEAITPALLVGGALVLVGVWIGAIMPQSGKGG